MKGKILYIVALSLLILGFSFQVMVGQEKTQEQKEKEAKLQQAIEQQKKAMQEQVKMTEQQVGEVDRAIRDFERQIEGRIDQRDTSRRSRSVYIGREGFDRPFVFSPGTDYFSSFGFFRGSGDSEKTSLDFSKSLKESTFSKQLPFEVEKNAQNVVMNIMGDCKVGEIKIRILMPGGKTYSEVVIDEAGNLNWRKSFTISGEENKDKTGDWIFKIDAAKATGYFRILLQTY
jgi:hypothetical protein